MAMTFSDIECISVPTLQKIWSVGDGEDRSRIPGSEVIESAVDQPEIPRETEVGQGRVDLLDKRRNLVGCNGA